MMLCNKCYTSYVMLCNKCYFPPRLPLFYYFHTQNADADYIMMEGALIGANPLVFAQRLMELH